MTRQHRPPSEPRYLLGTVSKPIDIGRYDAFAASIHYLNKHLPTRGLGPFSAQVPNQMFVSRPKVSVHILSSGDEYACCLDESLLKGMARLGKRGIPVGCASGGCGVCKVRVVEGDVRKLGPVSRAHVTEQEEAQGYTLACRAAPTSNVLIEVNSPLRKPLCRPA